MMIVLMLIVFGARVNSNGDIRGSKPSCLMNSKIKSAQLLRKLMK